MPQSTPTGTPPAPALAVVRPFGPYRVGDLVTDPTEAARLLTSEQAASVVCVHLPQER